MKGAAKSAIQDAERAVLAGHDLADETVSALVRVPDADLPDLFRTARRVRAAGKGSVVTFSPKVFIPLTQLCRDHCGYCTFRKSPRQIAPYLTPDAVLQVAQAGERLGCREALFTLGERPEQRYPEARAWLEGQGFSSTIDYLAAMCEWVLEKTRLLPHSNPGTMTRSELRSLKPVNASLGMMLESVSLRLMQPGGPHYLSPSKHPRARLMTLERAGQERIPFTTGILLGLGDSVEEQVAGLLAIRSLHRRYGHIQEIIIQNFRAKPETAMAEDPEPDELAVMRMAAVARLAFGPAMNIQVPPNLTQERFARYLDAGINDWGGISPVTPDYVNPEAPWPAIDRLAQATRSKGLELRPRYPVYPAYLENAAAWLPPRIAARLSQTTDDSGYIGYAVEEEPVWNTTIPR